MPVTFELRDMIDSEYKREQVVFDEHGQELGNPPEKQERIGFVASENDKFVGASNVATQKTKIKWKILLSR